MGWIAKGIEAANSHWDKGYDQLDCSSGGTYCDAYNKRWKELIKENGGEWYKKKDGTLYRVPSEDVDGSPPWWGER